MITLTGDENGKEHKKILRAINGALRSAINDHGPITKEIMGSASKRVVGALKSLEKSMLQEAQDKAEHKEESQTSDSSSSTNLEQD